MRPRWVLHVDMDAFYAAIEVLDDPSLAGVPLVIGGSPSGRGVVSTASYEARRFGVRSAMPAATAVRLCPHAVFLPPRMDRYVAVSRTVREVLERYSPLVEPLSIDEAFLDITGCFRPVAGELDGRLGVERLAREVVRGVREATGGLTCSVGAAPNKFLAKVASDLEKPAGLVVVPPDRVESFLAPLPVRRLWGVGPRTEEKLHDLGLRTVGDVRRADPAWLVRWLGPETGAHLARLARGEDDRPVSTGGEARSVSQERTFAEFIPGDRAERIEALLLGMSEAVASRLRSGGLRARVVTIKVRDEDFRTLTRSRALTEHTARGDEIFRVARDLWRDRVDLRGRRLRLLGVGASHLTSNPWRQGDFFEEPRDRRSRAIDRAMDRVNAKLGDGAVTRGGVLSADGTIRGAFSGGEAEPGSVDPATLERDTDAR